MEWKGISACKIHIAQSVASINGVDLRFAVKNVIYLRWSMPMDDGRATALAFTYVRRIHAGGRLVQLTNRLGNC